MSNKRFIPDDSVSPFTIRDTQSKGQFDRFYNLADALEYFGIVKEDRKDEH